jgi:hypothetical protein
MPGRLTRRQFVGGDVVVLGPGESREIVFPGTATPTALAALTTPHWPANGATLTTLTVTP